MARPAKVDRDEALQAAMELFWRRGYEGVSIEELVGATRLSRSSLYGSFGSKAGLFRAALERYIDEASAKRAELIQTPGSTSAALEAYFEEVLAFSLGPDRRLGCLLVNAAVEVAPAEPSISQRLVESFTGVEQSLTALLERGQRQGEIPADRDAVSLARLLLASIQGLRVLARAGADEATLRGVVDGALAAIR